MAEDVIFATTAQNLAIRHRSTAFQHAVLRCPSGWHPTLAKQQPVVVGIVTYNVAQILPWVKTVSKQAKND